MLVRRLLQQSRVLRGSPSAETSSSSNGTGVDWEWRADAQGCQQVVEGLDFFICCCFQRGRTLSGGECYYYKHYYCKYDYSRHLAAGSCLAARLAARRLAAALPVPKRVPERVLERVPEPVVGGTAAKQAQRWAAVGHSVPQLQQLQSLRLPAASPRSDASP